MDEKKKWKKYGLWQTRCRLNYLKNEIPLMFNFYDIDSGKFCYLTYHPMLDELKDPNKRIAVADVDWEITKTKIAIERLEESVNRDEKEMESED